MALTKVRSSLEESFYDSISDLKTNGLAGDQLVYVKGYSSIGDGGEGQFAWDSSNLSSNVTADTLNGIYVPPFSDPTGASGAWVRQFNSEVNVEWFGSPSATTIQAAHDMCTNRQNTLVLMNGGIVDLDSGITFSKNINYNFNHRYLRYTPSTGAALTISCTDRVHIKGLHIVKQTYDYSQVSTGIQVNSLRRGSLEAYVQGFYNNVYLYANNDGIAYNRFYLILQEGWNGLRIANQTSNGWVNTNAFYSLDCGYINEEGASTSSTITVTDITDGICTTSNTQGIVHGDIVKFGTGGSTSGKTYVVSNVFSNTSFAINDRSITDATTVTCNRIDPTNGVWLDDSFGQVMVQNVFYSPCVEGVKYGRAFYSDTQRNFIAHSPYFEANAANVVTADVTKGYLITDPSDNIGPIEDEWEVISPIAQKGGLIINHGDIINRGNHKLNYAQGKWIPTGTVGGIQTIISSYSGCVYSKIGNTVHLTGKIVFGAHTADGNAASVTNLPFAPSSDAEAAGMIGYTDIGTSACPVITGGTNYIQFYANGLSTKLTRSDTQNKTIVFSISYKTDND